MNILIKILLVFCGILQSLPFTHSRREPTWDYQPMKYVDGPNKQDEFFDRVVFMFLDIFNFTGDNQNHKHISIGVFVDYERILTSYNPFRPLIKIQAMTRFYACYILYRNRSSSTKVKYDYECLETDCGRPLIPMNDEEYVNEQWHGPGKDYSPVHDLLVLKLVEPIDAFNRTEDFTNSDLLTPNRIQESPKLSTIEPSVTGDVSPAINAKNVEENVEETSNQKKPKDDINPNTEPNEKNEGADILDISASEFYEPGDIDKKNIISEQMDTNTKESTIKLKKREINLNLRDNPNNQNARRQKTPRIREKKPETGTFKRAGPTITRIANKTDEMGDKVIFGAVGLGLIKYSRLIVMLETSPKEDLTEVIVYCDEWLPNNWGHFICIKNDPKYKGFGSGAVLFSGGVLFGVGSFTMWRGKDSILVFTDVRPYNELIGVTCTDYDLST